jgi:hypothetical protein
MVYMYIMDLKKHKTDLFYTCVDTIVVSIRPKELFSLESLSYDDVLNLSTVLLCKDIGRRCQNLMTSSNFINFEILKYSNMFISTV